MKRASKYIIPVILTLSLTACGLPSGKTAAEKAVSKYPGTESTSMAWEEYPEDNLFGLIAVGTESDNGVTTIVLVFDDPGKDGVDPAIIREYNTVSGVCPYGYFEFDETEITEKSGFCYVRLAYDSRITLNTVMFDIGDERCNVDFKDGLDLTYCDFRDPEENKWLYQAYDDSLQAWGDITDRQEINDALSVGVDDPYVYTMLGIDESGYSASNTMGSVTIFVYGYDHKDESYNIYGEVKEAAQTTIEFNLVDDSGPIKEQDVFRLYRSEGGSFVDITPSDCTLNADPGDGSYLSVKMQSSLLGALSEGDYRLEYGIYSVDFRLSEMTYEVW